MKDNKPRFPNITALTRLKKTLCRGVLTCLIASSIGFTGEVNAVPAYPGVITLSQPDGSSIEVLMRGDERSAHIFSEDGYLLNYDSDGMLVYATLDNEGLILPSKVRANNISARNDLEKEFLNGINKEGLLKALEREDSFNSPTLPFSHFSGSNTRAANGLMSSLVPFPTIGEHEILVVLVQFQDHKFVHPDPAKYFDRILNEKNYKEDGAYGSARDWFSFNSMGKFNPHFDVLGPVTLSGELSDYGEDRGGQIDPDAYNMVIEACKILDPDTDFTKYDANNDGFIDNVYVYYAGKGQADTGISKYVWPHSFDIYSATRQTYKFDGVILNHYATSNEVRRDEGFTGIGTFMHEFGHVLGLPDLYTTNYTTAFTPGPWSIMDYGPYNNNGMTPPNYTAYERYCLGWLQPTELYYDGHYELKPLQDSNQSYIVKTDDENEIFLFDNRQQKDYDQYIPGHGMLVWRITFDQNIWDSNSVNNIPNRQRVDILEADNIPSEENRDADTFPGTKNKTEFGPKTRPAFQTMLKDKIYYYLTNIAENNGIISFDLTTPNGPDTSIEGISCENEDIYTSGNIIKSTFNSECEVFDLTGRKVGKLPACGDIELSKGTYIIVSPKGSIKILI